MPKNNFFLHWKITGYYKGKNKLKLDKPSVSTELTLVIAMRTIAKINFKIILNFFFSNHDLMLYKSRIYLKKEKSYLC